jgi:hypothetical protein
MVCWLGRQTRLYSYVFNVCLNVIGTKKSRRCLPLDTLVCYKLFTNASVVQSYTEEYEPDQPRSRTAKQIQSVAKQFGSIGKWKISKNSIK